MTCRSVDPDRCRSCGQSVCAAPDVFRLVHEELLEWEYVVDDERGSEVRQAVRACPVRARNSSDSRGPRHRLVDPDRIDDRPTWCERPHERGI